ncbi:biotin-dependent carboxyltransferase family protein [bacterium]|nr:biotin-dependent carboxyltransferase family protein [bacterium]
MITILSPGPMTTVQDEGRWGYQGFGMPPAGAMDRYAYRVANLLAGNRPGAAALEMTIGGATLRFDRPHVAAICGADMGARLNGKPVANWSSFSANSCDELRMNFAATGCRAYLAVQGGINVPAVLGSRSTCTRAGIGGHHGRQLRAGDSLPIGSEFDRDIRLQALCRSFIPEYRNPIEIRVLSGPQDDYFTPAGIETFYWKTFKISYDADRMGFRLDGPEIEHRGSPDIVSDALCTGSVQVPGHGRPIVLMADRQTAGGYPKIATVIGPDVSCLAQGRPGDRVRFVRCSEEEALGALRAERDRYGEIARWLKTFMLRMQITINGVKFETEIREG